MSYSDLHNSNILEEADSTATWFYHDLSWKVKTLALKWVITKGQTPKIEVYEHRASTLYDTGGRTDRMNSIC
jgi:hypothetical protein